MSAQDASDVTKALAAFGAPSIRYHSFRQGTVRPSSVVLPHREPAPPGPPVLLRQFVPGAGPDQAPAAHPSLPPLQAAPGPRAALAPMRPSPQPGAPSGPAPAAPMPLVPAFRRTMDPASASPAAAQDPGRPQPVPITRIRSPVPPPSPPEAVARPEPRPLTLTEIFAFLAGSSEAAAAETQPVTEA